MQQQIWRLDLNNCTIRKSKKVQKNFSPMMVRRWMLVVIVVVIVAVGGGMGLGRRFARIVAAILRGHVGWLGCLTAAAVLACIGKIYVHITEPSVNAHVTFVITSEKLSSWFLTSTGSLWKSNPQLPVDVEIISRRWCVSTHSMSSSIFCIFLKFSLTWRRHWIGDRSCRFLVGFRGGCRRCLGNFAWEKCVKINRKKQQN